jgi:hypothetical protein
MTLCQLKALVLTTCLEKSDGDLDTQNVEQGGICL